MHHMILTYFSYSLAEKDDYYTYALKTNSSIKNTHTHTQKFTLLSIGLFDLRSQLEDLFDLTLRREDNWCANSIIVIDHIL